MSWGVYLHVCVLYLFIFPSKAEISSATFVDCGVTGSYILPLSLFASLPPACEIDRAFVGSSNGAGERIQSSAGCSSSAEMLLGKEVGQSQKPSPLSPSVLVTLRPRWACQRASGWMNRPPCLGLHTEELWKAEWNAGLWSLSFSLNECKLTKTKLLKVNIHLFWGVFKLNIICIRILQLLQQVRGERAHHSRRYRTASGRCLFENSLCLKKCVCMCVCFPPSLSVQVQGTEVSAPVPSFLLCRSRLSGGQGDGAPRGSAM